MHRLAPGGPGAVCCDREHCGSHHTHVGRKRDRLRPEAVELARWNRTEEEAVNSSELMRRPVGELAERVRSGEITARELVEAALVQIEANRHLNAFTYVDAEAALAAAD